MFKLGFKLKLTRALALLALCTFTGLAQEPEPINETKQAVEVNYRAQDLPPACDALKPPSDQVAMFRLYAAGTQNYRWNGTTWIFVEPVATLYADAKYHNKVGMHYAGPTWETNFGTKVTAARVTACTPEATAIPWLLLQVNKTDGPGGILTATTYIQRINTKGGLMPTAPGAIVGATAEVPYTTEYIFFRAKN
ncbi:MAG: DUF3455 domain-containing protein [Acidobacteria bacterium]|nr:DUF3455 domain-containing protein [Acidobacteriota bacterium]